MASKAEADRALIAHREDLLKNPNITLISVILDDAGQSVIQIGLAEAERGASRVPKALAIPGADGVIAAGAPTVAVVKRVVGRFQVYSFTDRQRPALGGDSCGPSAANWFGTLGARVQRGSEFCVLSNWHVLYGDVAFDGDPIVQPAHGDGGFDPDDTIADNTLGVLSQYVDAAVAQIRKPVDTLVTSGTRCYGAIAGTGQAAEKMAVRKCGRTTESTAGTVRSTNATVVIDGYPGGPRTFHDQLEMTPMAEAGDSGSIILDDDNKAVGLLFSGGSTATFANKIDRVFAALGIAAFG